MAQIVELKSYSCNDIKHIDQWFPHHNKIVYPLTLTIGLAEKAWGENYQIIIATPEGLSSLSDCHPLFNEISKYIIVNKYSWHEVEEIIEEKLADIEIYDFYDWQDIHEQLLQTFNEA